MAWISARTCRSAFCKSAVPSSRSAASCNRSRIVASSISISRRSCARVCATSARKLSIAGSCALSTRSASAPTRCSWPSTFTRNVATDDVISSTWVVSLLSSCDKLRSEARKASSISSFRPTCMPSAGASLSNWLRPSSGTGNVSKRERRSMTSRSSSPERSSRARNAALSSGGGCRRLTAAISARACRTASRTSSPLSAVSCVRSRSKAISCSNSRLSCIRICAISARKDSSAGV
mmetsp:Transcript_25209/g.63298  ORF Transcript_25209/g.63298 Transcript_25209/m.63298 type:complete len:236 (-) Transcript_25209:420-1127(-)